MRQEPPLQPSALRGRVTPTRAVHTTGRKLYVEMTFAPVRDNQGVVCGSVAIAPDVTARVEQERSAERRGGDV